MKVDILNLQFEPYGRDPEAIFPLIWYLENIFQYNIIYGSMLDSRYLIDKYQPEVLLLNNIAGNEYNVIAAQYAYKNRIKVISLTSEGLYFANRNYSKKLFWGDIKNKKRCWDKMYFWSEFYYKKMINHFREFRHTFDVSGSTGLDRYKMYKFVDKKTLLKKYKKTKYTKLISYFGYTFSTYFNKNIYKTCNTSDRLAKLFRLDFFKTKNILKNIIYTNKDILFILKKHPAESNCYWERNDYKECQNVLFLEDEESLGDIINASDLILLYDSTISYEAYALNKTVINLVLNKQILYYTNSSKGNLLAKNTRQLQRFIDEYYKKGFINKYVKKEYIRNAIIKRDMESDKGINSWITANKINSYLRGVDNTQTAHFSFKGFIIHIFLTYNKLLVFIPYVRNSVLLHYYNNFNLLYKLKNFYNPQIKKHFTKFILNKSYNSITHNLQKRYIDTIL